MASKSDLVFGLLTNECYEDLVNNYHITPACFSFLVSKVLGYGIIAGSSIVKVPQILKIAAKKSAEGLDASMFAIELLGYIITLSFSYISHLPISTYGEYLFMTIQNCIILFLIHLHGPGFTPAFFGGAIGFISLGGALLSGYVEKQYLSYLQTAVIPVLIFGRLPQIWKNFQQGHTGHLSAVTFFLQFAGSAARIYTTWRETKEIPLMLAFIIGTVLNGIIFVQIITSPKVQPKKQKKVV
eukprot:CAMPEP_0184336636 /NCGR_PEP_ID=MMETSP1089-20130417/4851_1 /TAXON_ID=38269 ORGANISM="Gloeochaete wittrockiana, Strain SAG46.84" /NCGR_SAMPLE_ID=MMETSP1089 /ASSEMBLY_ACC=CAM_ASM_000445 /LENGTH=240 /DNA_ID=CAMNT_0026661689 /DNA_START=41 /DNA_END=763 /DNA_ORIENTATION=+